MQSLSDDASSLASDSSSLPSLKDLGSVILKSIKTKGKLYFFFTYSNLEFNSNILLDWNLFPSNACFSFLKLAFFFYTLRGFLPLFKLKVKFLLLVQTFLYPNSLQLSSSYTEAVMTNTTLTMLTS